MVGSKSYFTDRPFLSKNELPDPPRYYCATPKVPTVFIFLMKSREDSQLKNQETNRILLSGWQPLLHQVNLIKIILFPFYIDENHHSINTREEESRGDLYFILISLPVLIETQSRVFLLNNGPILGNLVLRFTKHH